MLQKTISVTALILLLFEGIASASSARWAVPSESSTHDVSQNIAAIPRENYDFVKRAVTIPDFIPSWWHVPKPFNLADYAENIPVERSPYDLGKYVAETYGIPDPGDYDVIFSPQTTIYDQPINQISVPFSQSIQQVPPAPLGMKTESPGQNKLAPLPKTIQAEVKFRISQFNLTGNTLLSPKEIDAIVSPYQNKDLSAGDLKTISGKLADLDHQKGYGLAEVLIPEQNISGGTVEFHVREGKLGKLIVQGNKHYSAGLITGYLMPAVHNGIINTQEFERGLLLLNEIPDVHAISFFKYNDDTVNALIDVRDKSPLHAEIDYNNYGNRFVAPNNAGVQMTHDNLLGFGDAATYRQTYPFPANIQPFVNAAYSIPVNDTGTKLAASYSNADVNLGDELQVLDVRAIANIYTFGLTQALVRTGGMSSNFFTSLSFKNTRNYFFGNQFNNDRVRELDIGYNIETNTDKRRDSFTATLGKGLGTLLGGMGKNDPAASRLGADDLFTKLNFDAYHIQSLGAGKYLVIRGGAQYAFSPLLTIEQYSLGGPFSVRGYPQAEFLGDSGWNLSIEGRMSLNGERARNPIQGVIFFDTGYVNLKNPQASDTGHQYLSGAGFGIRSAIGEFFAIQADLGFPLSNADNTFGGKPILYFQGVTNF